MVCRPSLWASTGTTALLVGHKGLGDPARDLGGVGRPPWRAGWGWEALLEGWGCWEALLVGWDTSVDPTGRLAEIGRPS